MYVPRCHSVIPLYSSESVNNGVDHGVSSEFNPINSFACMIIATLLEANSDVLRLCDQTYVWISPVGLHYETLHCSCSSLRHTLLLQHDAPSYVASIISAMCHLSYCITLYFRERKISRKVNLIYFRENIFSRIYCSRENIFPRKYLLAKISSREIIFPRKYLPANYFPAANM